MDKAKDSAVSVADIMCSGLEFVQPCAASAICVEGRDILLQISCQARNARRSGNQTADDSDDEGTGVDSCLQSHVGAITPTGVGVAAVSSPQKALMHIQGKKKAFFIDTGAGANLISSHDVDVSKLKVTTPGQFFHTWNGSVQKSLGRADISLYNPKQKRRFVLNFDIVLDKLTPILGSTAVQIMNLITVHKENFDSIAAVLPVLPSREEYIERYPAVFQASLGRLEGAVSFQVDPDVTPSALPARQVPIALRELMKKELERLQKLDVITPVTKPTDWVSQAVILQKADKSVRLCIDPRPLNQALMQRKTRTASLPQEIQVSGNDRQAQQAKQKRQQHVKSHHDKTATELKPLARGTKVWFTEWRGMRETWTRGIVTSTHGDGWSYFITTPTGQEFRRNRIHIRLDTTITAEADDDEDDDDDFYVANETRPRGQQGYGFVPPATTKSGRAVKPVLR